MKTRIIVIAAIAAALLVGATAANAAAVSWHQAIRVTKRAASKRAAATRHQAARLLVDGRLLRGARPLALRRRRDARLLQRRAWISGTERRPVVRRVAMACFD